MQDSAYTDPDMIRGLYLDPENEVLLAEYALQTGGIQMGVFSSTLGATGNAGGAGTSDDVVRPCFTGDNEVLLFNAARMPFAELYERREEFVGKGVASFTPENILVPGKLEAVLKRTVYELLHVKFKDEPGPMRMHPAHRFWIRNRTFRAMQDIRLSAGVYSYDRAWQFSRVESKELVSYPEGVDVYNLTVGRWHNYFAAFPGAPAKAVSNTKRIEE